MGAIVAFIIQLVITVAVLVFGAWLLDNWCGLFGGLMVSLGGAMAIVTLVFAINAITCGYTMANLDVCIAKNQERSIMYTDMVRTYEQLRNQDITASDSYLNLYKEIIDFNHEIDKAERHNGNWMAEGLLYDPSYVGVDMVPLRILK